MNEQARKDHRHALVQGASRGLGLAFVRQLAARPDTGRVFATCRDPARATALAGLAEQSGKVDVLAVDVTDPPSIEAAAKEVAGRCERLDTLINVAGVLHDGERLPERRVAHIEADWLQRSFAVNATGPALMARHFEALLGRSELGVFASLSARVGSISDNRLGGWYAYRASKAALNMLTRTLSIEWGRRPRPIVALALHPGTVDTDLSRPFQGNVPDGKLFDTQRAVEQLLAIIDSATVADSGRFIAWDGQDIPF